HPGDVGGFRGGEEGDDRGDLVRVAETARGGLFDTGAAVLLTHVLPGGGEDGAGQYAVDAYVRPVLDGELAGQRGQSALGGGVCGPAGQTEPGMDRGGEDDAAACGEVFHAGTYPQERPREVDGELVLPGAERGSVGRCLLEGVGVGDKDTHRPEGTTGRLHDLGPGALVAHVGTYRQGSPALRADPLGGSFQAWGEVGQHHRGAFGGQAAGGGFPDALGRAGDHGRHSVVPGVCHVTPYIGRCAPSVVGPFTPLPA